MTMNLDDKRVEAVRAVARNLGYMIPASVQDKLITAYLQAPGEAAATTNDDPVQHRLRSDARLLELQGGWPTVVEEMREAADYIEHQHASHDAQAALIASQATRIEELEAETEARAKAQKSLSGAVATLMRERDALREAGKEALQALDGLPMTGIEATRRTEALRAALSQSPVPKPRSVDERDSETERLRTNNNLLIEFIDYYALRPKWNEYREARAALTPGNGVGDDNR